MTDADIIHFPSSRIVRENPPDPEILQKSKERAIMQFGEQIVSEIMQKVEEYCLSYGLEDKEETFKDKIYLLEIVRAMVYRTLELEHPMHSFIEKTVQKEVV